MRRTVAGVTLVELMIVVAIASILAVIAYPSFMDRVYQSRRADGHAALLEAAMRQQRFYTDTDSYTTDLTALGFAASPAASADGYYNVSVAAGAGGIANAFVLTATPQGAQTGDTTCGNLTLSSTGVKGSGTGSAKCW